MRDIKSQVTRNCHIEIFSHKIRYVAIRRYKAAIMRDKVTITFFFGTLRRRQTSMFQIIVFCFVG